MSDTEHDNPEDSVCTEFSVRDDLVDEDDNEIWAWAFECTRCGHETPCEGDPRGFGGRPYSCMECGWVSLLEQEAIESFAEERYVDTRTDHSENNSQPDDLGEADN